MRVAIVRTNVKRHQVIEAGHCGEGTQLCRDAHYAILVPFPELPGCLPEVEPAVAFLVCRLDGAQRVIRHGAVRALGITAVASIAVPGLLSCDAGLNLGRLVVVESLGELIGDESGLDWEVCNAGR